MRTDFFNLTVPLLTETFPGFLRWLGFPVLVIIAQEDGRLVPLTPPVDLSPASLVMTDTEPAVTARVGWAGSDTLVLSGPPDSFNIYYR